jgi:hypothetical protein
VDVMRQIQIDESAQKPVRDGIDEATELEPND